MNLPGTAAATVYNGSLTVSNGTCSSTAYPVTITIDSIPQVAITSVVSSCAGTASSVVFTGTPGAIVAYTVNGGAISNQTLTGGTYTFNAGNIYTNDTVTLVNVHNGVCTNLIGSDTVITPIPMVWTGTADGNWNNAANWSCGSVPDLTSDVTIPSGTPFAPSIASSGTGTTRNLTIASGASVNLNSSSILNVKGDLLNNASVTGTGSLSLSGSAAQHVAGLGTVTNVDVNNAAGVTINTGALLTVTRSLSLSGGTLTTNDSLVLSSDSIATARILPITASGAGISGNVQAYKFVLSGHRAYRFVAHPFNSSIPLSQLENYIDITGAGGALNGFTGTATNAASAFRYDPTVANSASAYDPGWKAYTDANGTADSNRFHQYQGIRLFFRGYKGQGLDGLAYTPGDAMWGMKGAVNTGDQNVTMVKGTGTNQDYNMIGNPYASPVDIGTVVHNAYAASRIAGSYIWVWNPYLGSVGNYQAKNISAGAPYSIEAYASFQVRAAHNGDQLNFTENNKTATADQELLKAPADFLSLYVYDANYHPWDMLSFQFDNAATDAEDLAFDAAKPSSPAGLNFYSKSSDGKNIMVDVRPYKAEKVVPLGITSSYAQDFIIKVGSVAQLPAGGSVYLHDKLLKQYVLLNEGAEYKFSITSDKATQGDNRFELSMAPAEATAKALQVTMQPNPASDEVNISFVSGKKDKVDLRVLDLSGVSVYSKDLGLQQSGTVSVSLSNFASGIYMVELTSGDQKVVQRLVKE